MANTENRELRITGGFRDRMSANLDKVRASVERTKRSFRAFGRAVTAPIRVAVKAVGGLASKVLSLKNLFIGFIAVLAVRRAFGFLKGIADDLDEIVKTSDRLQATTESLSALKFVGELAAIQFSEISAALAIFSRNLEAARRGSVAQADAFRQLGLDVESLADLERIDLIDLLADVADGFGEIESATERNNALLTVFGRSGSRLGPLLAGGSKAIRDLADEAERLGVVWSADSLNRAAAFNDALARFQTSIRGVAESVFVEFAPNISATFELLASKIGENRDQIVRVAAEIGSAILTAIDAITDAIIGFIDLVESIPGVDLVDLEAIETQRDALEAWAAAFGPGGRNRAILDGWREAVDAGTASLDDFFGSVGGRSLTLGEAFDLQALVDSGQIQGQIDELTERLRNTLAEQLRKSKDQLAGTLGDLAAQAAGVAEPGAIAAGAELGAAFAQGFADAAGGGSPSQGDLRASSAADQRLLTLQRTVLGLLQPTEQVQQATARLNAELQRVALQQQLLEFLENGRISLDQARFAFNALGEAADRDVERVTRSLETQALQFDASVLGMRVQSSAVRTELVQINAEIERLGFEQAFADALITEQQFDAAIEALDEKTARLAARARGEFGQGWVDGVQRATDSLLDLGNFAEQAAGTTIRTVVDGLSGAMANLATGAKDAREAFQDFGRQVLQMFAQLIAKALILRAINYLGGTAELAEGGVLPGTMRQPRPLPIREYATGGIARSPQVAVFGEGRGAEAFVPLPDGRRIPVDMRGGNGGGMTIVVQTIDSKDTARWFLENRGLLLSIQRQGLESSAASRQAVRQVG